MVSCATASDQGRAKRRPVRRHPRNRLCRAAGCAPWRGEAATRS